MDHSKTQIFKLKDNKIANRLKYRSDFKEKEVQQFYEAHLEKLLDAQFVETEFAFDGGRIDTFAVDNDNNPLIIEYKKDTSDSVLLQALYYKEYIERNWEKGYYAVVKKLGQKIADEVNWKNIRVIIIGQEFDKWTKSSTSFLDNVELYRFSFFEDGFFQEYLNLPKSKRQKRYLPKDALGKTKVNKYPSLNEADFSKDEFVISSGGKIAKTNLYTYNKADHNIQNMFDLIQTSLDELIESYELVWLANYWYVKSPKKFAEFTFRKNEIIVALNLKNNQSTSLELRDVSSIGHHGTLESEIRISQEQDLDELMRLMEISYKNSNKEIEIEVQS